MPLPTLRNYSGKYAKVFCWLDEAPEARSARGQNNMNWLQRPRKKDWALNDQEHRYLGALKLFIESVDYSSFREALHG